MVPDGHPQRLCPTGTPLLLGAVEAPRSRPDPDHPDPGLCPCPGIGNPGRHGLVVRTDRPVHPGIRTSVLPSHPSLEDRMQKIIELNRKLFREWAKGTILKRNRKGQCLVLDGSEFARKCETVESDLDRGAILYLTDNSGIRITKITSDGTGYIETPISLQSSRHRRHPSGCRSDQKPQTSAR